MPKLRNSKAELLDWLTRALSLSSTLRIRSPHSSRTKPTVQQVLQAFLDSTSPGGTAEPPKTKLNLRGVCLRNSHAKLRILQHCHRGILKLTNFSVTSPVRKTKFFIVVVNFMNFNVTNGIKPPGEFPFFSVQRADDRKFLLLLNAEQTKKWCGILQKKRVLIAFHK